MDLYTNDCINLKEEMPVNILYLKINAKARGYDEYNPTERYVTQRRRVLGLYHQPDETITRLIEI